MDKVNGIAVCIKTVDIQGKHWFDKVNGNSYFSARVTINYGMEGARTYYVPFEYGYGEQYIYASLSKLADWGLIDRDNVQQGHWGLKERGVIVRYSIMDAKKAEVKAWGKAC